MFTFISKLRKYCCTMRVVLDFSSLLPGVVNEYIPILPEVVSSATF